MVTKLERRYPKWNGLNLTIESLEGIAKHESSYDRSAFVGISQETGPSLEAQIANIADDLAYNAHDLDDGLQAGLLNMEQLNELEIWRRVVERMDWKVSQLDEVSRHHIIRELVGQLVDDVLFESQAKIEALGPKSALDVQLHPEPLLCHSLEQRRLNAELKDFLYHKMYRHFRILQMQTRAKQIIEALFSSYINEPRQLPDEYQARMKDETAHRVVADYIASLTDRSALREYQNLFDPISQT